MRKTLLAAALAASCALSVAQAQTIKKGDCFYDGVTLFTVQEVRMGNIVYLTDASGDNELTLEEWPNQPGTFTLQPSRNADDAPYGVDFGTHIDYVRQPDNRYLLIYGDNDTVAKILPLVRPMADIAAGSLWYNGDLVYDANPAEDGSVRMNAMAEGEEQEFLLIPAMFEGDLFMVEDGPNDANNQYEKAAYARRIRQEGLDVICFYDEDNRLMDVMEATKNWNSDELNRNQWMAPLCGNYRTEAGKDVVIDEGQSLYNGKNMPMEVVSFNGMPTGLVDFGSGGPYLVGKVEAVPTQNGIRFTEVKVDEDMPWMYDRTVSYFDLTWTGDRSRFDFANRILLNGYLRRYDKSFLRFMRNAILAAHGYVFQSKDLKTYFEAQPWYKPAASNSSIKLSLLEQLNVSLIQAAERAE